MPPTTSQVRIIGGRHRGRRVRFPAVPGLRPTPDRVRETLFNWLGQDLTGRSTLEPYAGSGVLSLEALSRGAVLAVAFDRDPVALRALRANALALGTEALEAHGGEARELLRRETRVFDAVFLDPPYADDPWDWLLPAARDRLAPDGRLYAEAGRPLAESPGLALVREGRAGHVHYHLYARC